MIFSFCKKLFFDNTHSSPPGSWRGIFGGGGGSRVPESFCRCIRSSLRGTFSYTLSCTHCGLV